MKPCTACHQIKSTTEFYKGSQGRPFQSRCKLCMAADKRTMRADPVKKDRELAMKRSRRLENLADARARDRDRNYKDCFGITVDDYNLMFLRQGGMCAICGNPETAVLAGKIKRLSVDHCHASGKVRGLLCSCCNTALGLLGDDIERVAKALHYLASPA